MKQVISPTPGVVQRTVSFRYQKWYRPRFPVHQVNLLPDTRQIRIAASNRDAEADDDVIDSVAALCGELGIVVSLHNQHTEFLQVIRYHKRFQPDTGQVVEGQAFGIQVIGFLLGSPGKHRIDD